MQIVDSNQKQLDIHTIIIMAVNNLNTGDKSLKEVLASIITEAQQKTCEVVNIGNTVFIGHRGKDKNKTKMVGRPLNVDTGRNYIKNMLKYIAYIQGQGITHYSSQFSNDSLLPAMRVMDKRLQDTDTELIVIPTKNNKHVVLIKIGEEPLSERF
jgi:hypothetical protein